MAWEIFDVGELRHMMSPFMEECQIVHENGEPVLIEYGLDELGYGCLTILEPKERVGGI